MSLLSASDLPDSGAFAALRLYSLGLEREKIAGTNLSGILQYDSKSGRLIVPVPVALVRGVYDAMDEPGLSSIQGTPGGSLRNGITAMLDSEVTAIGGADNVTERGKSYAYTLSSLKEVPAKGWPGVSVCWFLTVVSPALESLRKSYGLAARPADGFAVAVACRKTGVLRENASTKLELDTSPATLTLLRFSS